MSLHSLFTREILVPPAYWLRVAVAAMIAACWLGTAGLAAERNVAFISAGSVWKYHASGEDPGEGWNEPGYDDSDWSAAQAEIGFGDGGEVTRIAPPEPASATTYFRRDFEVSNPQQFTAFLVRMICDDGAVIYLNGVELLRPNMPDGAITFDTPASASVEYPMEGRYLLVRLPALALVAGRNTVAIEVHQAPGFDDLSFDFEIVGSSFERPAFVVRGPYLQRGTSSEVTVRWRTDVPTATHVRFGPVPELQSDIRRSLEETTEHEVRLAGLNPDTEYYYTIGDGVGDLEGAERGYRFRTAPAVGSEELVRMWVLGDSGTGGDGFGRAEAVRDAFLRSPLSQDLDLWLMLGDNAYFFGTDAEYQAAVFDTYRELLRHTVLWSTLGNHETYTALGAPYFNLFTLPRSGEAGGTPSGTESYYSFDYANIHFVCLDSMISDRRPEGSMLQWLKADLAETSQEWIIAFWHHPPYTRGSHDSDWEIELVEMREQALPILEEGGVDLVLSGHSHSYERSYFLDGHYGHSSTLSDAMVKDAGDGRIGSDGAYGKDPGPHGGAVYVVAGSSGHISGGRLDHPVMFASLNELGSLILDVQGRILTARFLNSAGTVRDYFTISKLPLVAVAAPVAVTGAERPPPGQITLSRTRNLDAPLPVRLDIRGSAKPDVDYFKIANPLTIPAGASSITIFVQPIVDLLFEGAETVIVTALDGTDYRLHRDTKSARVTIHDEQMEMWRVARFGADAANPEVGGDDADPDDDQQSNAAEFIAGTEPREKQSLFRARVSRGPDGSASIQFEAAAERSYTVQFKDALSDAAWQHLADIAAHSLARSIAVRDPGSIEHPQRFYRVIAPKQEPVP